MRKLVLGDVHGGLKAFEQVLERSGFNNETDQLISLGDIVDGWGESFECVDRLLKIKNMIAIKGNHDDWWKDFMQGSPHPANFGHGGRATFNSYKKHEQDGVRWPTSHYVFFQNQIPYYKDEDDNLFIHGGFNRHLLLSEQRPDIYWWDRDLFLAALSFESSNSKRNQEQGDVLRFKYKETFNNIFIGHTPTINWNTDKPMKAANVWNIDTGAAFTGKLTLMDVDTKEYWQSDPVRDLYGGEKGRN